MISDCIHFVFLNKYDFVLLYGLVKLRCVYLCLFIDGQSDWFRSLTVVSSASVSTGLLVVCDLGSWGNPGM